jgi:hypothetical protein
MYAKYSPPLFFTSEHHTCLSYCKKVRWGLQHDIPLERIKAYSDWFYATYVVPYFKAKRELVYTIANDKDPCRKKALAQQRRLCRLFSDTLQSGKSLGLLEEELELHLRFEELVFFPKMWKTVTPDELENIETNYTPLEYNEDPSLRFWK